jgi:hypothetical protein
MGTLRVVGEGPAVILKHLVPASLLHIPTNDEAGSNRHPARHVYTVPALFRSVALNHHTPLSADPVELNVTVYVLVYVG